MDNDSNDSVLPAASFRFRLMADTLAVRLTVPRDGPAEDLHLQVQAPCRAHKLNTPSALAGGVFIQLCLHSHRRVEDLHPVRVAVRRLERGQPDFLEGGVEHVLVVSGRMDPLFCRAVRPHVCSVGDVFTCRLELDIVIPEDGEHVPAIGTHMAEDLGEFLSAQARCLL